MLQGSRVGCKKVVLVVLVARKAGLVARKAVLVARKVTLVTLVTLVMLQEDCVACDISTKHSPCWPGRQ